MQLSLFLADVTAWADWWISKRRQAAFAVDSMDMHPVLCLKRQSAHLIVQTQLALSALVNIHSRLHRWEICARLPMLFIGAFCDLASVRRPSETASKIRVYMNVEPSLEQTLARVTLCAR